MFSKGHFLTFLTRYNFTTLHQRSNRKKKNYGKNIKRFFTLGNLLVSDHSPPRVKILTKDLRSKYDVHYPNINVFHRQNIENFFLGGPPPLPTPNGKFRLKLTMKNDVDFPSKKKNYGKNTENRKIFLFWSTLP